MSSDLSSFPVLPHGGVLVDRIVSAEEAVALRQLASERPALRLDARELADLELIATGAASPLTGFLTESDYASVVEKLRLANGTVWPLPLTLAVPDESKKDVVPGAIVALEDASGRLWGVIEVKQVFERDPLHEARHVYATEDPAHPGVAYLLSRPRTLAGGPVRVLPLSDAGAEQVISSSAVSALLDQEDGDGRARGELASFLVGLAAILEHVPELADVLCNPVIVGEGGAVAA